LRIALAHQQDLIRDVRQRDIIIDFNRAFCVHQQIHNIRNGGGHPTAPLVVELVESFRCVSISVARCGIFNLEYNVKERTI